MSASTEFALSLPFLGYKQRNAVLDNFVYDTASLTLEERAELTPLADREGSIIVVPPGNSDRQIRFYSSALRFMTKEGPGLRAVAIAGVGSSALGTAALARSIADALDTDVAGIVTGYGLTDMMSEALGAWLGFGAADRIRYTMEKVFERMRPVLPPDIAAGSAAAATLSEILLAGLPKLDTLVAHSKGALVASHALHHYVEDLDGEDSPLFKRLRITTLGAVVALPPAFKNVKQYLGALDWYGGANSSLGVTHDRLPGVSHHLNPGFPYHMSVAALLNWGAAPRLLPRPAMEEVPAALSIPLVEVRKVKTAAKAATAAPAKAKAPVRKPVKTMAKPVTEPPKVVESVVRAAPKAQVAEIKQPSVAAKPAIKPVPRKATVVPTRPMPRIQAKTAAANGKLVVKTSKKEAR